MRYRTAVHAGFGRGKQLGFPTYNVDIPAGLNQEPGIYAAWVWINDDKYQAATHFGPVPMFKRAEPSLEFFLLNYAGDQTVKELEFELVQKIRSIQTFASIAAMQKQIALDVSQTKRILEPLGGIEPPTTTLRKYCSTN